MPAAVESVYQSLMKFGVVLIYPECKMNYDVTMRIVRDHCQCVRSMYIMSDQIAIVCFDVQDTLLQQTVTEKDRLGRRTILYDPVNPQISFEIGYNSASSQVQHEVLVDLAYATVGNRAPNQLIHFGYFHLNLTWRPSIPTRLAELPSTEELDELANLL